MARLAVADGIEEIIATPHLYLEQADFDLATAVETMNLTLREHNIPLIVHPGFECHYTSALLLQGEGVLAGGRYSLVEFPTTITTIACFDVIYELLSAGVIPVIAHPERNLFFQHHPQALFELLDDGALVQITAGSLSGTFGGDSEAFAVYLLKRRRVAFIASDAHSARERTPQLTAAVRAAARIIGMGDACRLVVDNPRALLEGRELGR